MAENEQKDTSSSMDVKEDHHAPEVVVGDSSRIDPEVAKYAAGVIEIDDATNQRIKWKLYRRVLPIMVVTYFLQALDKGTLSFSSIMNLPEDTGLVGQQVSRREKVDYNARDCLTWIHVIVFLVDNMHLYCCFNCRIPTQLDYPTCSHCQISRVQCMCMERGVSVSCSLPQLCRVAGLSYLTGYL